VERIRYIGKIERSSRNTNLPSSDLKHNATTIYATGCPRYWWKVNIQIGRREIRLACMEYIDLAEDRDE
jgi:hypothetical protein